MGLLVDKVVKDFRTRLANYSSGMLLPTQEELADEYSVSTFTIHRAIKCLEKEGSLVSRRGRGTLRIPDKYVPKESRSVVGLVISQKAVRRANDPQSPFGDLIVSLQIEFSAVGMSLLLQSPKSGQDDLDVIKSLIAQPGLSAMVLMDITNFSDALNLLSESSIPTLVLHPKSVRGDNIPVDTVMVDLFEGARQISQRFFDMGHKNLGYVGYCSPEAALANSNSVQAGLESFVQDNRSGGVTLTKIELPSLPILDLRTSQNLIAEQMQQHRSDEPTIWITRNMILARATGLACNQLGISIPSDVSLVSLDQGDHIFDGHLDVEHLSLPRSQMGATAAKLLEQRLAEPDRPVTHKVFNSIIMPGNSIRPLK